jgi:hypothetical protein
VVESAESISATAVEAEMPTGELTQLPDEKTIAQPSAHARAQAPEGGLKRLGSDGLLQALATDAARGRIRGGSRHLLPRAAAPNFHRRIVLKERTEHARISTLTDLIILPPATAAVSAIPMSAASGR